jgi:hypothetical protein
MDLPCSLFYILYTYNEKDTSITVSEEELLFTYLPTEASEVLDGSCLVLSTNGFLLAIVTCNRTLSIIAPSTCMYYNTFTVNNLC